MNRSAPPESPKKPTAKPVVDPSADSPNLATASELQDWLATGRRVEARDALAQRLERGKLARDELAPLANVARRLGLINRAVTLLHPVVRPSLEGRKSRLASAATPTEIAEYAAALAGLGVTGEALSLLEPLNAKDAADRDFFLALVRMGTWEYELAIPNLEAYLAHPRTSPYFRHVAQLNLIACRIYARELDSAESLIDELERSSAVTESPFLVQPLYELRCQVHVFRGETQAALRAIEKIDLPREARDFDLYQLNIAKWRAVAELKQPKYERRALERLAELRRVAERKRFWEAARDCDYRRALHRHDETSLLGLYFGSSVAAYRRRVLRSLREIESPAYEPPKRFNRRIGGAGRPRFEIEIGSGVEAQRGVVFKKGQALQRLLESLASDSLKAFRLTELFGMVFSESQFNPVSSPDSMHSLMLRFRARAHGLALPLEIRVGERVGREAALFRLEAPAPGVLVHSAESARESRETVVGTTGKAYAQLLQLRRELGTSRFTAREAAQILGVSTRQVARVLAAIHAEGRLRSLGTRRSQRYELLPEKT